MVGKHRRQRIQQPLWIGGELLRCKCVVYFFNCVQPPYIGSVVLPTRQRLVRCDKGEALSPYGFYSKFLTSVPIDALCRIARECVCLLKVGNYNPFELMIVLIDVKTCLRWYSINSSNDKRAQL